MRKAKRRIYDKMELLEGHSEKSQTKNSGWMTNLFSTKPSYETPEERINRKDLKLIKFYDSSINKLKMMILNTVFYAV